MPDITLRAYSKEIDDLIEHDQLDEAISHCRHILQTYPKHLGTYRSLGKSYLEAKRYGDAADIFQRVLSAIPDDFVSHIGMSIVREDEGNLDASIWHMERAFETNPANPAIQQELRRLIGRRDGLEPHKVRLTRGALARMYAQGELYPQAIAELRSALAEDSDRPDLDILLAKMYWNTEQLPEAVDICHAILNDLPFCLEANKIMAAVLQMTGKADDARSYQRRLVALDPYTAFLENAKADPHTVDPASVRLAKLDWVPGQPMPSMEIKQTDWAATLGVDSTPEAPAADEDDGEMPGWMAELDQQQDIPEPIKPVESIPGSLAPAGNLSPDSQPFSGDVPDSDGSIPEWMRDAGWSESDGQTPEKPVDFTDAELESLEPDSMPAQTTDTGDLAPADIPDWLQDIAPEDTPPVPSDAAAPSPDALPAAAPEPESEGAVPNWLNDIAADAADVTPEPASPSAEQLVEVTDDKETGVAEVPSWLDASSPGATSTIVTWLGDKPGAESEDEPPAEAVQADDAVDDHELPSWMSPEESDEIAPEEDGIDKTPSWLSGVAEAAAQPEIAPQIISAPEPEEELPSIPETGEEPEAPDWLQAIASSEEPEMPTEDSSDESPDWLSDLRSVDGIVEDADDESLPSESGPDEDSIPNVVESADWLNRIQVPDQPEPLIPEEQEAPAEQETSEKEDWLARLSEPDSETTSEPDAEPAPEWLSSTPAPESSPLGTQAPDWLSGIGEPEQEEPNLESAAESLDWLDGIAESEPSPTAEEEGSLDWLNGIEDQPIESETPVEEPEKDDTPTVGEIPDWLDRPEPAIPTEPAGEEMDWLQEFEAAGDSSPEEPQLTRPVAPEVSLPADSVDLSEADDGEVMQWLETLAEQQNQTEIAEAPVDGTPAVSQEEQPAVSETVIPETTEEGLDWLEELADTRGLDDSISIDAPAETAAEEGSIEWLSDMAEPEKPQGQEDLSLPHASEPVAPVETESTPIPVEIESEPLPEAKSPLPVSQVPESIDIPEVASDQPEVGVPTEIGILKPDISQSPAVPIEGEQDTTHIQETAPPAVTEMPIASEPAPEPIPAVEAPQQEPVQEDPLETAQALLSSGDAPNAAKLLGTMIKRGKQLDQIIATLDASLEANELQPELWQTLGDAYMKNNQMTEAIQAYQRGMEVA